MSDYQRMAVDRESILCVYKRRMKGRSDDNLVGRAASSRAQSIPKQTSRVIRSEEENVSTQSERDASVPPPDEAGNRAPQTDKSVAMVRFSFFFGNV